MKRWQQIGLAIMTGVLAAAPVHAQDAVRPKALSITATIISAAESAQDADKSALHPGDAVRYELEFTNVVDVPVQNVAFTDRIPHGLVYVSGSSASDGRDVTIEYSIDGGATYHETPLIDTVVDGERVRRPAPPQSYTHIRWLVRDVIQPRAKVTAEFRARLPNRTPSKDSDSSPIGRDG